MSNDVVSEIAAWTARAAVAREAGVELEGLSAALGDVVASNYFGRGCDEGQALYVKLRNVIGSGIGALVAAAETATSLSVQAGSACNSLAGADAASAESIRSGLK